MKPFILFVGIVFMTLFSLKSYPQWTQKSNFAGTPRFAAVGFGIGNKGYIGTGEDSAGVYKSDLWEYDPVYNTWVQKADYPATERRHAVGFSISNKGYLGTGWNGSSHYKTFKEFDPLTNAWTNKAYFGGDARRLAVGFSIGSKAYIGTGYSGAYYYDDFWEYDPSSNTWTQKANVPNMPRSGAVGFSIGSKGYIGTGEGYNGYNFYSLDDFWEYDPATNIWTQKADFGGGIRYCAVGFSIGSKGYVGTGQVGTSTFKNDFWEYDPVSDTWTQLPDFAGVPRSDAVGFSIGLKGYIGTSRISLSTQLKDFWEFNPLMVNLQEPQNKIQLSIFPNPSTDCIHLLTAIPVSIEIISNTGKIVTTINDKNTKFTLNISDFAKGVYYIKAINSKNFVVKKVLIQ